ncbi:MAG: hypothetical protein P4L56_06120 [Candidatus Sulfopaludibacter sp.]|nr:hypothetical protein [Candidatus Sulfopaludibacter sp.]
MPRKTLSLASLLFLSSPVALAQWDDGLLKPFVMDHRGATTSPADVSFLLDAPAGKGGFIRIRNGHFVKPDGRRIRFWGVHFTDWSRGSVEIPPKEDMPMWAATLARYGVNLVRLHFLDLPSPRGIVDASGNDSRSFDPQQLDRLDFEISEFKKRGIYVDLNLNVGRSYKAGDGVQDFDKIQWGKGLTLYDPRLIELEKEYAQKLLTHVNPYTKTAYRDEPAIAIVEILNENGLYLGFRAPTPYYDDELTRLYNTWLQQHRSAEELAKLRGLASVAEGAPVPRLKGQESAAAPKERYNTEMAFYMDTESKFYEDMSGYLKKTLGVKVPITGTADHSHTSSPYSMLASLAKLDILDGHVYWEHPGSPPPVNTPMVNDPLHSTVVQLSRTAFAGKPYTVSETNHPFPNEWASEGIPVLAAYGSFQDWDAIVMYTFEPKRDADWKPYVGDPFDISLDPVRMTEMAAGALMFLRGDVRPARQTVNRTYSAEQVLESRLLPRTEQPYFTPGFPLALPLEHGVRIQSLAGAPTEKIAAVETNPIVSDTKELSWYTSEQKTGMVTVETDRTQALIGFIKANHKTLKNLGAGISNNFATIVLSSMDDKPLARSGKMLLTAGSRVSNTGLKWNEARTRTQSQGGSPSLIEPVAGTVTLRNLDQAAAVSMSALDGAGKATGEAIQAKKTADGWVLPLGDPVTTWYVVTVRRH